MQYPPSPDSSSLLDRLRRFLTLPADERHGLCSWCGQPLGAGPTERVNGRLVHDGCADQTWQASQW